MRGKSTSILVLSLKLITFTTILVNAFAHMDPPKSDIRETLESLGEKMMWVKDNINLLLD